MSLSIVKQPDISALVLPLFFKSSIVLYFLEHTYFRGSIAVIQCFIIKLLLVDQLVQLTRFLYFVFIFHFDDSFFSVLDWHID